MYIEHALATDPVDIKAFSTSTVIDFIRSQVSRYKPTTIRHISTSLRNFFRYLRVEGFRDDCLDKAVPAVVSRRLSTIPRFIEATQLEHFIASIDPSTPCARRNRAMVLCIARLGLRASELVRIRLEDIDWRGAVLHIPTRKTGRGAKLPLLPDVGEAVADYITNERPKTRCRQVFVLHQGRIGEPASLRTVSDSIASVMKKAGVVSSTHGPNLLRHTLATRLIRSGASLKEVADLMGHRCLATTQVYAKLDFDSLREVAMPWPEVVS